MSSHLIRACVTVNLLKREIGSLIGDENDVFDFIKPNEKESRTLRADLIYVFFFFAFWNRNEYPIFILNQNENSENSIFFQT